MQGLEVRNLSKRFGGLVVSENINFDLQPGARKALIGPNGAGKSTFANLVTGILQPTAGEIRFDGQNIAKLNEAKRVRIGIAKTFQITNLLPAMTVRENLRLPVLERRRWGFRMLTRAASNTQVEAEVDELLGLFELTEIASSTVADLAYGQQRLVEMAMTLALKPKVLILDEPAAGVPSSETHLISNAIGQLPADLAVLIIEHDMELVFSVARDIVVLVQGRILLEGTPEQIAADPVVREVYLGSQHD